MTTADDGANTCACGCGTPVKGKWARGHAMRGAGGFGKAARPDPLPPPGTDDDGPDFDDDDLIDADTADPDPAGEGPELPGWVNPPAAPAGQDRLHAVPDEPVPPDPEPGHLRAVPSRADRRAPRVRVTVATRKDITAKIRMVLMPAGKIWEVRDPLCGGTFVMQEAAISAAFAEIVCDSPDMVAWFTGPVGGWMKFFELFMAVQPVALTAWAHHVRHSIELVADPAEPVMVPAYTA